MSATDDLRRDHKNVVRRLRDIAYAYSSYIYSSTRVPVDDVKNIISIIEYFITVYHHHKEEYCYFPRVYGTRLEQEAHALKVEHELGRRIASMLNSRLDEWISNRSNSEPVARILKAYADYLSVHMDREENFFNEYDIMVSHDEQNHISEEFSSITNEKMSEHIFKDILNMLDRLEDCIRRGFI